MNAPCATTTLLAGPDHTIEIRTLERTHRVEVMSGSIVGRVDADLSRSLATAEQATYYAEVMAVALTAQADREARHRLARNLGQVVDKAFRDGATVHGARDAVLDYITGEQALAASYDGLAGQDAVEALARVRARVEAPAQRDLSDDIAARLSADLDHYAIPTPAERDLAMGVADILGRVRSNNSWAAMRRNAHRDAVRRDIQNGRVA